MFWDEASAGMKSSRWIRVRPLLHLGDQSRDLTGKKRETDKVRLAGHRSASSYSPINSIQSSGDRVQTRCDNCVTTRVDVTSHESVQHKHKYFHSTDSTLIFSTYFFMFLLLFLPNPCPPSAKPSNLAWHVDMPSIPLQGQLSVA
jgi:hypothetical protein